MALIKKHLVTEFDFYREMESGSVIRGFEFPAAGNCPGNSERLRRHPFLRWFNGGFSPKLRGAGRNCSGGSTAYGGNNDPLGVTEQSIAAHLDNPDIPDPDLIIRTASEKRISNFLLWEGAYAEFYFSDKLWPDWSEKDLFAALQDYQSRDRRFGGIRA